MNNSIEQSFYQHLLQTWNALTRSEKGFFVFMLFTLVPSLSTLLAGIFNRIGLDFISTNCKWCFLSGSLLFMFPFVSKKLLARDVIFFLSVIAFIYLSPMIWNGSEVFVYKKAGLFLWTVVPYFFVGLSINYERQHDFFVSISRLALFIELLVQVLIILGLTSSMGKGEDGSAGEQMTSAYGFVFSCMYLFIIAMESRWMKDRLMAIFACVLLLFMGTRGPILVYAFFVTGYLVFFRNYKNHNNYKKAITVLLFVVLYKFIEPILLLLMPLAQSLGFSTRIFDSFMDEQMFNFEESNGRDAIWESLLDSLKYQPEGYGWGGDRFVRSGDWLHHEGYAHNLWLEMLVQFGYYLGGIIIALILFLTIRAFIKANKSKISPFLFIWFSAGIMALQTSQTYISYPVFFVFLGYCVSLIRKPKIS